MLNAADVLGDVLDRVSTFAIEHWIFLAVVVVAVVWRRASPPAGPARTPAPTQSPGPTQSPAPAVSVAIIVAVSLAVSIGYAWLHGIPLPQYHDDFAYLLDADTFARGRISNPTHPLWPHFETMHVLQVPRYIAKFPVGQGLVFAAGIVMLHSPLAAMWILGAAACVAVWWALRAFLTPWLALLGALAVAIHPTMQEWMESYHGGALAALGGALLIGAAARTKALNAVAAAGVVLLAISRPYEGVVLCLAVGVLFVRKMTPAGGAIVIAGLALIGLDNRAITGSPFVLPYTVYEQQYDPAPNFLWESARPMPHYRNEEMAFVYRVFYFGQYRRVHAPGGLLDETLKKFDVIGRALFGPSKLPNPRPLFLLLPIALIPLLRRERSARVLAIALLIFAFAPFSIIWWLELHYLAPAAAIAAALAMLALARTAAWSPILAIAIVILFVANAAVSFVAGLPPANMQARRTAIAHALMSQGGRHLIVVAPDVFDAVYNGADIDRQPVVWARDLGMAEDARLLAYFRGRKVWRLEKGGLRPY